MLAGSTLVLIPAVAVGGPAWRTLGPPSPSAVGFSPEIAVDPAGNVAAVWANGTTIQGSYRPAESGAWIGIVPRSPDIRQAPSVVIDNSGSATLAWVLHRQNDVVIQAIRRPAAGGALTTPLISSASLVSASSLDLGIDAAGNVTAVWMGYSDSRYRVHSAELSVGTNQWTAPRELASAAELLQQPQLVVTASGRAAAIWIERVGVDDQVVSAIRPQAGVPWLPTQALTSSGGASSPRIGVDASGTTTAMWSLRAGTDTLIQTARRGAAALEWSPPVSLEPGIDPHLVVDDQGNATSLWWESAGTAIRTSTRRAGSETWTTPTDLARDSRGISYPNLSSGHDGAVAAIWLRGQIGSFVVQAAAKEHVSAPWSPTSELTGEFGNVAFPRVAMSPAGAAAIWGQSDAGDTTLQAAAFDNGRGPAVRAVLTPARAFVGLPVAVRADVHDLWSEPTTTTWTFPPGLTKVGATAVHSFARAGKYTLTARSVDAVGNPTDSSREITVRSLPRCGRPIVGDGRSNVLRGTPLSDLMIGGGGRDRLMSGDGNDCARGGVGHDQLDGGKGMDQLHGGPGRDGLIGGRGDDVLRGGRDADYLQGDQGVDVLLGGDGDDNIAAADGVTDTIDCGGGRDYATLDRMDVAVGCEFPRYAP